MRRQFITCRPQFTTAHPTPLTDRHGQFTGVTTTACATIVTAAVAIEGRDERCGLLDWHGATAPFASPFAAPLTVERILLPIPRSREAERNDQANDHTMRDGRGVSVGPLGLHK